MSKGTATFICRLDHGNDLVNQFHLGLGRSRILVGSCPRCRCEPPDSEQCAVCMLKQTTDPTTGDPVISVYVREIDGKPNGRTKRGWYELFSHGAQRATMTRHQARIFERKNGRPPKCL